MCFGNYYNCILVSVLTILESLIHFVLTIYGLCLYDCHISTKNLTFFLYVTYFYDSKCGKLPEMYNGTMLHLTEYYRPRCEMEEIHINFTMQNKNFSNSGRLVWKNSNIIKEMVVRVKFPKTSRRSGTVFNFMVTYVILDILWLITAYGLLYRTCSHKRSVICCLLWLLVTAAVIILDTIAIIVFSKDIWNSDTATNWLHLVGAKNIKNVTDLDWKLPGSVTTFPAVTMLLASSRVFVFYILNLFFFLAVLSALVYARRSSSYDVEGKIMLKFDERLNQI